MCFDDNKRQPGSPAYLLDQGYVTTQHLDWTALPATLDRFEQEAGQFFQPCVTDHFHQALWYPKPRSPAGGISTTVLGLVGFI